MNRQEFHRRANLASDSVYAFAEFAKDTEHLFSECSDKAALEIYRATWFELEIVNAVALAEWEADARPRDWGERWHQTFRGEAIKIIDQIVGAAEKILKA